MGRESEAKNFVKKDQLGQEGQHVDGNVPDVLPHVQYVKELFVRCAFLRFLPSYAMGVGQKGKTC